MTTTLTIEQEMTLRDLVCRGFSGAELRRGLSLSSYPCEEVVKAYREARDEYRAECIARAQADPHKEDACEYLAVRGIAGDTIRHALGLRPSFNPLMRPGARWLYKTRQLERARAVFR